MLSDSDFRYGLQQIDGRQRTKDKLPLFATIDGWFYPPRLNLEQCSSELTARYKAELLKEIRRQHSEVRLIDGTGGYGVDAFFMSSEADETHYFEQNADLAAIAEHNFRLAGKAIRCHAEAFDVHFLADFIEGISREYRTNMRSERIVLYLDPSRRDVHGGKVFRLEDCTPDVQAIIRYLRERNDRDVRVLLKLSPMLDVHRAIVQLGGEWDVYVVSVANEVKELLLLSDGTNRIHAVSLDETGVHTLSFTPDEEVSAQPQYLSPFHLQFSPFTFLYEPDAAIMKAGAFKLVSSRYDLKKADPNTHLYFGSQRIPFPGRTWQVIGVYARAKEMQRVLTRANVLTRNYPLQADGLRKQLRLKDGGDEYIIGCRVADKPLLLHCRRCAENETSRSNE